MVAPTPMETARSLMAQIADWLLASVWALAIGSIPGMAVGLIPWGVFGALWGAALAGAVMAELPVRAARPRPRPAFRNCSPRCAHPPYRPERRRLP